MPKLDLRTAPREAGEDAAGRYERLSLGDAGGLTQFGVAMETLWPGARSSDRHWHSHQDEFLVLMEGEAVLVENEGEVPLVAGDMVAWPKAVPNGHMLVNRSQVPCRFLVVGTRTEEDSVHYPDIGAITHHHADGTWTRVNDSGDVIDRG